MQGEPLACSELGYWSIRADGARTFPSAALARRPADRNVRAPARLHWGFTEIGEFRLRSPRVSATYSLRAVAENQPDRTKTA